MHTLNIKNIYKQYGQVEILKDINISIGAGEFLILVGPSGCGKSTLLGLISGLESVSAGEIFIGDRNVTHMPPKDRDIAMVFQSYALYPNMTVRGNISFGMQVQRVAKTEINETIARVAKLLQIEPLLDRKPSQLSGGQRQRVAMGRALARNPSVFLFDEPLSNLDAKLRVEMRAEIKFLHQRMKTTIVYVTHDQIEAMTLGSKIAVMKDGVVQQFGAPAEVYARPDNLFVASFMGSPSMNFVPVTLSEDGRTFSLRSDIEEKNFPTPNYLAGNSEYRGKTVILGVRPEHFHNHADQGHDPHFISVPADMSEFTGPDLMTYTNLNQSRTVCRIPPREGLRDGDHIELGIHLEKAAFYNQSTELRIE